MLTVAAKQQFGAGDRQRGDQIEMLEKLDFVDVGHLGINANVDGSFGETYSIAVDFRRLDQSELGVHCDCPRFADRGYCKHLWATIAKYDILYDSPLDGASRLKLRHIGHGAVDCGVEITPLFTRHASNNQIDERPPSTAPGRQRTKKPTAPKKAEWLIKLDRIAGSATGQRPATSGVPAELAPETFQATQHWFVLSLSDRANANEMRLVVMRGVRKRDGDWGRPVAVELTADEIQQIADPRERRVLSLLQPVEDNPNYRGYGYRRGLYRVFSARPSIVPETLQALFATGRLAWKLGDSKQHFEDAQPVDAIASDPVSSFRLSITRDHEKRSNILVAPELKIPEYGTVGIDKVMWCSRIGCALVLIGPDAPGEDKAADKPNDPVTDLSPRTCLISLPPDQCDAVEAWRKIGNLCVPKKDLHSLLHRLSESHGSFELHLDDALKLTQNAEQPAANCLLEQNEPKSNDFTVSMTATYSDRGHAFDSPTRWWYNPNNKQVHHRNFDEERRWLSKVDLSQFELVENDFRQTVKLDPERFLNVVESFREAGWTVIANGAPIRVASDFDIRVNSGVDWFELDAHAAYDDTQVSLPTLLQALQNGQQAVVLDDGTLGVLPEQWLSKFGGVEQSGESVDGTIRFHRSQGLLLDLLLEEHADVQRDRDFSKFLRQLRAFDGIKPARPTKSFSGTLRDYQCVGLGWLRFLQKFGFGGCLADEMGLGKTVQVLAHLESRRKRRLGNDEHRKPSIIVVPRSLIFNWLDEAEKFAPRLRVRNHTGSDRDADWDDLVANPDSIDVLLTTYGTMRIDAPLLRQIQFDYAILDEAQAIKNPKSLVARAARLLVADHRLAMTGTPVENHLGDLWSLFDFLNPGMTGGPKSSSRGLPDMQDPAQRRQIEKIGKSLKPFILRRTKSEVLTELPEKVEQTLACPMGKKQQTLYQELKDHYRVHLSDKVKEIGLKRAKIHVLEALLRLRQAACDPRLVRPDCGVRGAKIDELLERLGELRQEGSKALVFSQFTSLLSLVRQDLDSRDWSYDYLDGRTRKRAEKVKRFQHDPDCNFFLISLKAGGSGLNLTAAEYVFILDPWWNPAVEAQAIDRAHRLGQTQSVNAYRMICNETVEEKIIELQRSKRDLADAIVSENKSLIGKLTAEDLQELIG